MCEFEGAASRKRKIKWAVLNWFAAAAAGSDRSTNRPTKRATNINTHTQVRRPSFVRPATAGAVLLHAISLSLARASINATRFPVARPQSVKRFCGARNESSLLSLSTLFFFSLSLSTLSPPLYSLSSALHFFLVVEYNQLLDPFAPCHWLVFDPNWILVVLSSTARTLEHFMIVKFHHHLIEPLLMTAIIYSSCWFLFDIIN